jgi:5-amino-6-(5-phospho-D-ribitylamino)uracil phosphatase
MGNAIEELKTLAKDVTLSNEEDGIAVYLNEALNLRVR